MYVYSGARGEMIGVEDDDETGERDVIELLMRTDLLLLHSA